MENKMIKINENEYPTILMAIGHGGISYQSVANRYGVSRQRIYQICKSHGIKRGTFVPDFSKFEVIK